MAKKPHSEVRWANKYGSADFGAVFESRGAAEDNRAPTGRTVRVRVTEILPKPRKKVRK